MSEIKYIVRVLGKDINGTKKISVALTELKGISHRFAGMATQKFLRENNLNEKITLGELDEEKIKLLEKIIKNPVENGLPAWSTNRQKDVETGKNLHLTMNELDFSYRTDSQRLADMKSYRGLRKAWGLTVRGQKTRSTHRTKGKSVSVTKKKK